MLLRHLTENQKVAIFAFGRMNPPTIGHKKLVDKITSIPGDHFLFLSHTVKPKTDPLSHKEKVYFAQKSFGTDITIGSPDVRTIIDAMKKLEALGYTKVIYVAGSDRIKSFDELLKKYNGTEYNFDVIEIANAGERDPDAEGAEGMSASKLKAAASQNDFDTFKQGVAGDEKLAQEMFDAVKQGMGIKNEILGFATRNVPRATIKKKRAPEEPSVADKLKARRAAAARGDKDAYTHKFNKKDEDLAEWFISMVSEGWSKKYKDSINCSNPKGFSQKAHCAGRKKDEGELIPNPKNTVLSKSDTAYDFIKLGTHMANINSIDPDDINPDEPDVMIQFYGGEKEKNFMMKNLRRLGYKVQDADGYKDAHYDEAYSDDPNAYRLFVSLVPENFADGKVKGKSRPGRVKKSGASCKGSVSSLRAKASKYGGEKGKMYHWCANMKGGKK